MTLLELVAGLLLCAGALFFLAGTLGILRFPDVHSRLHALTKADNLGLGFVVAGLATRAEHPAQAVKLAMIWGLVLLSSSVNSQLIAAAALRDGDGARNER